MNRREFIFALTGVAMSGSAFAKMLEDIDIVPMIKKAKNMQGG